MTPQQPQQEKCLHWRVCKFANDLLYCPADATDYHKKPCLYDSRPHTNSTGAPEKEVLDLLKKKVAWGKEIDRNHLFDYHNIEQMIEEAEQRIESLRAKEQPSEAIER